MIGSSFGGLSLLSSGSGLRDFACQAQVNSLNSQIAGKISTDVGQTTPIRTPSRYKGPSLGTEFEKMWNESKEKEIKKEKSAMNEVLTDIKKFVREHKAVIYTVALVVVIDHFFLGGKLRQKIEDIASSALDGIKGKLDGTKKPTDS